jgi:chromosomal replication initiation ATPase DnaA
MPSVHQIGRLFPQLRLLYLSSERFTNDLINAIRYDRTSEFRAKYRTIDLLLIDDYPVHLGQGANSGRVLSTPSRSLRRPEADRRVL